ncbi:TRAFAC clade GTPase domain-containing protein [Chitinimonas sp. BJB300]|uniref:TRAFAC clade GTPase domain-containing protein n=1 Tax=Chitinimonas sp. BJB300 TaxID=1559339 RepID=UPI00111262EB|nr:hypothetical protein [Chitinimonas sp. BJB300]TSJ83290.1 hypothetical protein FG002_021260 [Chitinimonas sp. BJB300]
MSNKSIVALGLPASGKTTFLAALWHLLTNEKVNGHLSLAKLEAGEAAHLRSIASRWLQAKNQDRTFHSGNKTVKLSLKPASGEIFELTFPDIAGEAFAQMWEMRECPSDVAEALQTNGVLLFIHADKIRVPGWIADDLAQSQDLGVVIGGDPTPWKPQSSPTQVQLVDILQCLQLPPLYVGPRRLAVILSAWDKVENDGVSPERFLKLNLPLLYQYLEGGLGEGWKMRVFGVSAQGADYDREGGEPNADAERMREIEVPSHRIRVVAKDAESHDLTEPVYWLLG